MKFERWGTDFNLRSPDQQHDNMPTHHHAYESLDLNLPEIDAFAGIKRIYDSMRDL
jgi:hypothetical protein